MALFLDGPPSSIEDLTAEDSGLLDVCRTEQIDVSVKMKLAYEEIAGEIEELIQQQQRTGYLLFWQPQLHMRQLAVTPSLKKWHTFSTLSLIYRDAYFSQLNDRFQAKWDQYKQLSEDAENRLRNLGLGVVFDPLPRPCQVAIAQIPATESAATYYFSVTTVNAAGEQSSPSVPQAFTTTGGNAFDLTINDASKNAVGWNVYAGTDAAELCLQSGAPVQISTDFAFYPSVAVVAGKHPGTGQAPNVLRSMPRLLQRG